MKETTVHTIITTVEIPAKIQFPTTAPGERTLRIMTLCRIGGRTIATRTEEKLPSGVKSPRRKSKDIETKQIAKEGEYRSNYWNNKDLHDSENDVALVGDEKLVGRHRSPVPLHHFMDGSHVQRIASDARDDHKDGDDDVENVVLRDGREDVSLHSLLCFVQQKEQEDSNKSVDKSHQQQWHSDCLHSRSTTRSFQMFLRIRGAAKRNQLWKEV